LLLGLIFSISAICSAEDRIVQRTGSGSQIGLSCILLDYTGRGVTYQAKSGGATKRLPRGEIVEVTTHYNESHTAARTLFAEGKAAEAFEKLNVALEQENRLWVRREILATQVKCALWNGDHIVAGERFLAIFESDPHTLYFPTMPLSWSDDPPSPELARAGRQWLSQSKNSAAQLLGASHLLSDPKQTSAALLALKSLAQDENPDIQRLAQMQLWRHKAMTEDVSREELLQWERLMEGADESLGGGPRFVLGMAWQQRREDVPAATAWLWLPFVQADDRYLVAQAAWNAGQALERAGQAAEAAAIYEELVSRFADTPHGTLGKSARERLQQKKD